MWMQNPYLPLHGPSNKLFFTNIYAHTSIFDWMQQVNPEIIQISFHITEHWEYSFDACLQVCCALKTFYLCLASTLHVVHDCWPFGFCEEHRGISLCGLRQTFLFGHARHSRDVCKFTARNKEVNLRMCISDSTQLTALTDWLSNSQKVAMIGQNYKF